MNDLQHSHTDAGVIVLIYRDLFEEHCTDFPNTRVVPTLTVSLLVLVLVILQVKLLLSFIQISHLTTSLTEDDIGEK